MRVEPGCWDWSQLHFASPWDQEKKIQKRKGWTCKVQSMWLLLWFNPQARCFPSLTPLPSQFVPDTGKFGFCFQFNMFSKTGFIFSLVWLSAPHPPTARNKMAAVWTLHGKWEQPLGCVVCLSWCVDCVWEQERAVHTHFGHTMVGTLQRVGQGWIYSPWSKKRLATPILNCCTVCVPCRS